MGMTIIDIVFLGLIAVFSLRCALRGFISEVMSMAALVFGLLTAIFFFRAGAVIVREFFMPDVKVLPEIIAFVSLFMIVFIIVKILELVLKNVIEGIRLGGVDRFLGFIFGIAEGIIIVCLVLFVISVVPFINSESILGESFFARILLPFVFGRNDGQDILVPNIPGEEMNIGV
jgi:membrane protein required for colicin V production